ncbi:MAG: glycosyltransferase family 87 protein [Chlamydiota bacterium]
MKNINRWACAALLLYCAGVILSLSLRLDYLQWDFSVYYRAPQAYARGLDPYRMIVPSAVEGSAAPRGFKFYYPPFMLLLFAPFSRLSYATAARLFFAMNGAALAALILIWRNGFLGGKAGALFYLFCMVSFNSPLYIALKAGNVAIMEHCALWLAFYFFLERRYLAFCLCVFVAAAFKGTPLLFLALLFFEEDGRRYRYLAGAAGVLCGGAAVMYAIAPELWAQFLHNSLEIIDKVHQPSTYAMVRELLPPAGQRLAYAALVAAVLACTVRAGMILRAGAPVGKSRSMLCLACAAYAVILPHFEDYSYIILIVPAYALLCDTGPGSRWLPICFFLILSSVGGSLPIIMPGIRFALKYSPLMLAYCIWGIFVCRALPYRGDRANLPD